MIKTYVRSCLTCSYFKVSREQKQKLLKSLFISNRYWQDIACDFVTNLLLCKSDDRLYRHILVMIDKLFKSKKFISMNFMNTQAIMQAFIDYIWRFENFSLFIVLNKNINFVTHFWKRFCKRLSIILKLFIAFHFETNEQIEIVNAIFKQYLRVYVSYNQNNWVNQLVTAEFVVNSHTSEFMKIFSFLIIKEYFFRSGLKSFEFVQQKNFFDERCQKKLVDKTIKKIEILRKYFWQKLTWTQVKQAEYVNNHRSFASKLKIDDKVFLDICNLNIARSSRSLNHKNVDFYEIVRVINNVVYELKLLDVMKNIWSIFHLWLLHLNKSNFLSDQRRESSSAVKIILDFIIHYVKEIMKSRWNTNKKNSNSDLKLDLKNRKSML